MSYLLNNIDLVDYGIVAGHNSGSNIATKGIFDLPARIGQTSYEWAEDSIEPWVDADEIFFGGRDLSLKGFISGTNGQINDNLQSLYDAVELLNTLVVLSTPYGNFNVWIKSILPEYYAGGCQVTMNFREPVVVLSGGVIPDTNVSSYTIDSVPFISFGLYYSKGNGLRNLSELKAQLFTKFGAEGYQIGKRKNRSFDMNCVIIGSSLSDFQNKIKALYLLFSSSGMRRIEINNEIQIDCFATEGFKIDSIHYASNGLVASFSINLTCTRVTYLTADSTVVTADDDVITIDTY